MHTMRSNPFKQALQNGQMQYGFWLGLCNPLSAELCAHTGYDWLLIDGEHAPNTLDSTLSQLQAIQASQHRVHPIVRLVDDDTARIKQYLDIGAQSLLIPMVEEAAQAEKLVQAMRYPPRGTRGVGTALARAALWNMTPDYLQQAEQATCLIIQIETVNGLDNLQSILAVAGIDAVFIGPADLAASMGYLGQPNHPEVLAAIEKAMQTVIAHGKPVGTLATQPAMAKHYRAVGAQFIALGVDTLALANAAKATLHALDDSAAPSYDYN